MDAVVFDFDAKFDSIIGDQVDSNQESYDLESMVKRRRKKMHRHKYRKRLRREREMK
jgi:hypothetical protein